MLPRFAIILMLCLLAGCNRPETPEEDNPQVDPMFQGTIGSVCELVGYQAVRVQGYSLVLGLPGTGSGECPATIKNHLEQTLLKLKDQGYLPNAYIDLDTEKIIAHNSTAVVLVSGLVPAGALKGDRFDVEVVALEGTQTTSLHGGRLMRTEMQIVVPGTGGRPIASRPTALAYGHIFINPFSVQSGQTTKADPRRGLVLGGGQTIYDSRIRLSLLRPDYRTAQLIQNRINSRFRATEDPLIAEASRSMITLRPPAAYRNKYKHFISLVWGLYLQGTPGFLERKCQELNQRAQLPDADLDDIALAWEAIGRPALPVLESHFRNPSGPPMLAYYAARTALNLDDRQAIDVLAEMALDDEHPAQLLAARCLLDVPFDVRARWALHKLLEKKNYRLRLLGYEGLKRGRDVSISSTAMPEGFTLDLVPSDREPIVAVWATVDPRIVIFGRELVCRENIFYANPDDTITMNARPADVQISVTRKLPGDRGYDSFKSPRAVQDLIAALVRPIRRDGKAVGPGLSFSQVAGLLYDLCQEKQIPAHFMLHRLPEDLTGQAALDREM